MKYYVRSFDFGNYLFIENIEPQVVNYGDDYINQLGQNQLYNKRYNNDEYLENNKLSNFEFNQ